MRRLTEIIIICLMISSYWATREISEFPVIYALISIGLCLLAELVNLFRISRYWQALPLLTYVILVVEYPKFLYFLPLLLYSAFATWGKAALLFLLLYGIKPDMTGLVFGFIAIYLCYRTEKAQTYARQSLKTTDELKEQMISLERYNAGLLENDLKSKEIARLEERNRIARELHDYLGHMISSSILQVEALKLTEAETGKKERLQLLQDTLSNGMKDIRKQLHGMYDSSFSLKQKLEELVDNTPELEIIIQNYIAGELSFEKKRDIFNLIREAMANTMKHSDATQFTVFLKEQKENQVLLMYDNGSARPREIKHNMGLTGMEDIVRKYRGKLNYYYKQGFHIHIVLSEKETA